MTETLQHVEEDIRIRISEAENARFFLIHLYIVVILNKLMHTSVLCFSEAPSMAAKMAGPCQMLKSALPL